ncbi:MAG: hypothetical protein UU40_C0005G0031 [Candidatus Uhrbacteria bacterium GW2011_GWD2_41_121]|uniref:Uncharacterized protein n=1 Tax=Candidatus Uhrbacteria bacterium GW2011_GWC1_41_20 TaxID=1618983 RepID=A0A0G0VF46_9BACT|nr:MAG: hypothetical protein UT52_C0007G0031 [Candidatus Uhrbacteria bacterium GW2011_GWE1_39_46]KKR64167.1 MAG: hypothetical protein UU04_C0005G0031 [Candidatus Uhrbacteria bacterium GW2011_GWC2_40_450]KKR90302.1 MAG: hypothetical protein UU40_C0005G0031 [Candidatus Uhrbacteria bacterium GW2011_GWD2_41_121]KKR99524.1 MAG: hypothetical protein UU50_C0005G0031 [Candidatus Uhrbacteria bacterium GW2011_GWC1_41_20]KKS06175.1 MAG: hypothetical protein UU60_C0005G0031 [Candidatus Uhrbacteria bacteriu
MVCGPSIAVHESWNFTVGAGVETTDAYWIGMGMISYSRKLVGYLMVEYGGGSGLWYKAVVTAPIPKNIRLGLMSSRYDGEGLYGQIGFGQVVVYTAILFQTEEWMTERTPPDADMLTGNLGIKVTF